jgi:ATP-dependent Clp protease ATP-binding subunit ClpX
MKHGTGARGLRSVLENLMLDTMFEIPSLEGVSGCVITHDSVVKGERPQLISHDEVKSA